MVTESAATSSLLLNSRPIEVRRWRLAYRRGVAGELLTPTEVAEWAKVSPATVRRWHRSGELPVVRLGYRTVRYRREDVMAFLGGPVSTVSIVEAKELEAGSCHQGEP